MERSLPSVELLIIELKLIVCLQTRLAAELGLRVYHGYIGSSSSTSHILRFSLGSKRATTAAAASVRPIGGLSRSRPATLISESSQTALASLIPSPVTTVKRRVSLGQILDKTGPPSPTGAVRTSLNVPGKSHHIHHRRPQTRSVLRASLSPLSGSASSSPSSASCSPVAGGTKKAH